VFIVASIYFVIDSVRILLDTPSYISYDIVTTMVLTPLGHPAVRATNDAMVILSNVNSQCKKTINF